MSVDRTYKLSIAAARAKAGRAKDDGELFTLDSQRPISPEDQAGAALPPSFFGEGPGENETKVNAAGDQRTAHAEFRTANEPGNAGGSRAPGAPKTFTTEPAGLPDRENTLPAFLPKEMSRREADTKGIDKEERATFDLPLSTPGFRPGSAHREENRTANPEPRTPNAPGRAGFELPRDAGIPGEHATRQELKRELDALRRLMESRK